MRQEASTPIPKQPQSLLGEQAFSALRHALVQGELRAGQMVSISELCEKLDFATAPVRDAVKKATAVGLVTVYPQRGIVVLETTPEQLYANFHFRYLIDQEGARLSALSPNIEELDQLTAAHQRILEEAQRDHLTRQFQYEAMELDWRLHQYLANTLHNPIALQSYAENCDRIHVLQKSRPPLSARIIPAMTEHLQILQAIRSGDTMAAMQAIQHHFAQTLAWWGVMPEDFNTCTLKTRKPL